MPTITIDDQWLSETEAVRLSPRQSKAVEWLSSSMNSTKFRHLYSEMVYLDGVPSAPIEMGGVTVLTADPGEHVLEARVDNSAGRAGDRLDRMVVKVTGPIPVLGRLFRRVDEWSARTYKDSLTTAFGPVLVTVGATGNVSISRGESRAVRLVGPGGDVKVLDPEPSLASRYRPPEHEGPAGSVRHSGRYRYELRHVEPIPHVPPGTEYLWKATASVVESIDAESPIRGSVSLNLGAVSASLTKEFGRLPSRSTTESQLRELRIPLSGDVYRAWEVRVYNVWQILEWIEPGREPIEFEYLSQATASAYEMPT